MTAIVALSWAPRLALPYGDNHAGRIFGRYALHLRNLQEDGLVGSAFSANWTPYSTGPYAHHPPLQNMLGALFGLLPGSGPYEILLGPHVIALAGIPAAAALLRGLGIRWSPTLLAVGLMAATGHFWLYSPLMFDISAIMVLAAAVVHLRRRAHPPRWLVVVACTAALVTTLASWPGVALGAALGLWLFAARRLDGVTVAVATCMVVGLALSLAFVFGVGGAANIINQTEVRTSGGSFTVGEFVLRQGKYAYQLLPIWYLVLLPVAVVAGLLDRRTRIFVAGSTLFAAGWVLVLNNGSFVHDYWSFPVLITGVVGMGVLLERVTARLSGNAAVAVPVVAGLALLVAFSVMALGPISRSNVYEPAAAGRLAADHSPPRDQRYAWTTATTARWLAYYWDLPPRPATRESVVNEARADDLVLLNVRNFPAWLSPSVVPKAVAREGRYALFRVSDLRGALAGHD
jgi:hypothetical protein